VLGLLGLALGVSLIVGGVVKGIAWVGIFGLIIVSGTAVGVRRSIHETRRTKGPDAR
jgi:hypothetical protein